ncbi:MAG TPA: glycoside hydrolase family 71/99-like protein [Verrucomicrobiae bacterium]|nr:glycoside hydrolase family 71/99-like protein [Verrucomicrobiae bacterium]
MKKILLLIILLAGFQSVVFAQSKHSPASRYPSYQGLVMCGYQGWFRAAGDGSKEGWVHYGTQGKLDATHVHLDFWPDVTEYARTYPTGLTNQDGTTARVFSSWDESTTDLHFRWMQQYGIDGVFVQRFFGATRTESSRHASRVVLENAFKASQKTGRAIAVMYDLSGLRTSGEDCSSIIQDWKELVDELKLTSQGTNQTYLYNHGKPLVAIWGLGFPDRSYNIRNIGIEQLIDFLKHDPQYGGCAVMLGVPTYFRDLNIDCLPDPYLHQVIASADIVMPWMVQRFTPLLHAEMERYAAQIKADIAWCDTRHLEYAPCIYPGFSWHNLSKTEFGDGRPLNQIPREKGKFYWNQASTAKAAGAKMLYVAMFDEMDEGTAIFKCANTLPVGPKLCDYEGLPTDHYLWLTGRIGQLLRGEIPVSKELPVRIPSVSSK